MDSSMDEIRFDMTRHRCWKGKESLSAVGSILKKAAEVFNPWGKEEITPEVQARMDRGKTIHETLELHDRGTLGTFDPLCEPYLESWKAAMRHFGIGQWEEIEKEHADPERMFWGVLDRFDPGLGVLEIKTGSARPRQYGIQCAAYCILKKSETGSVVYITEQGFDPTRDIVPVTAHDFLDFEVALRLAKKLDAREPKLEKVLTKPKAKKAADEPTKVIRRAPGAPAQSLMTPEELAELDRMNEGA